ncbi:MAG: 4Fe-4S dicluster domain-containing protein [bacterium]
MPKIVIDKKKCKGCAMCVHACPKHLIIMSKEFNKKGYHPAHFTSEKDCTGCGLCFQVCPDLVIEVWK